MQKEMTLDCSSLRQSRVISLNSWVQSLVNLLFYRLDASSVTSLNDFRGIHFDELSENICDRKRKKKRLEQILKSAHGPV